MPNPNKRDYEIIDDRVKGDANRELGGVRIQTRDGKRLVSMTPAQAKWFLEHGAVKLAGGSDKPAVDRAVPRR